MEKPISLVIAGILLLLGLIFIWNTDLIKWLPAFIHYLIGILAIIGALYYGMKGLK